MKEALEAATEGLSEAQVALLVEMARALQAGLKDSKVDNEAGIASEKFTEHFGNRLLMHHATSAEVFKKKSFEFAFDAACKFAGMKSKITKSGTHPGEDLKVNDTRFSLKTEAGNDISEASITVSKLMEARWIRDCKNPKDFAERVAEHVVDHLSHYERIVVLRVFREKESIRYDLVEIPTQLLRLVGQLAEKDYPNPGKKSGGCSVRVKVTFTETGPVIDRDKGEHAFSLRLDGSVEKVTISSLKTKRCTRIASWTVPLRAELQNGDEEDEAPGNEVEEDE